MLRITKAIQKQTARYTMRHNNPSAYGLEIGAIAVQTLTQSENS